ncbi:hypothetical protein PWT90_01298 [Aphanocladium album]|nr:hypothetical protein PWT90_01298 [Aphanocladium album]
MAKALGVSDQRSAPAAPAPAQPALRFTVPQIVMFGLNNAGKSSIVRSLTGCDVYSGFINWYPWCGLELQIDEGPECRVSSRIKFTDVTKEEKQLHEERFKSWSTTIGQAILAIKALQDDTEDSEFILRVTISGPNFSPLSIVDLPGAFPSEYERGMALTGVKGIVHSYLKNENNIIVAVVAADGELAVSRIINAVTTYDPCGKRTIGVITKPDLVYGPSILRKIRERQPGYDLLYGWHVLSAYDMYSKAEGRSTCYPMWALSSEINTGIGSLREKLSQMNFELKNHQIQAASLATQRRLNDSWERLDSLGPERTEVRNMRSFLLNIASEFEKLSLDAISGHYNNPFFRSGGEDLKLRKHIWRHGRAFSHIMQEYGPLNNIARGSHSGHRPLRTSKSVLSLLERYPYNIPKPQSVGYADLCAKLNVKMRASSTGLDYGGGRLEEHVMELFMEYSATWRSIALQYVSMVLCECKAFVEFVFRYLFRSCWESAADVMLNAYVDPFFEQSEKILESAVNEIMDPYEQGYAIPFEEDVEHDLSDKAEAKRKHDTLTKASSESSKNSTTLHLSSNVVSSDSTSLKKIDHTADELYESVDSPGARIIDTMEVFYERSRATFTDNIVNLVVERRLTRRIWSLFTAQMVIELPEKRIEELASESPLVHATRKALEKDHKELEEKLRYLRKYRPEKSQLFPIHIQWNLIFSPTPQKSSDREKSTDEQSSTSTGPVKLDASAKDSEPKETLGELHKEVTAMLASSSTLEGASETTE